MGNDNIQQLSSEGPKHTHTHTSIWPAKMYKVTEKHIKIRQPGVCLDYFEHRAQCGALAQQEEFIDTQRYRLI